jgi:hypothetical protein
VSKHGPRHETCPNCGRKEIREARFCPDCGQPNQSLDVPVRHLVEELIEHTLHLDSKLFRTAGALLLRPGFLTQEFIAGRRERYVPPVRLYVVMSLLFFFLLAVVPGRTPQAGAREGGAAESANDFNLTLFDINAKTYAHKTPAQIDSLLVSEGVEPTRFNSYIAMKVAQLGSGGREEFNHTLKKSVSYMMFLLMPIFALYVYVLFRRRVAWYQRALIYSVHFHSVLFLLLSVELLVAKMLPGGAVPLLFFLATVVYVFLSLRRLFGEGVLRTGLKMAVIGSLYIVSMLFAFILMIVVSLVLY